MKALVNNPLLYLVIIVACHAACYEQSVAQSAKESLGGLQFKTIDGTTFDSSKLHGQVVVVSFGATWCRTCAEEMTALEQLKQEFQSKPVKFLWVSIESETETSDKLLGDYAKTYKLTVPVLRDMNKKAYDQFTSRVRLPLIAFYDKNGKFSDPIHVGMSTGQPEIYKNRMRERINSLLAGK
jgi:thiol-disulfide isomerase/thioredoxin